MNKKTMFASLLLIASHVHAADKAPTFGSQGIVLKVSESVKAHPFVWAAGGAAAAGGLYWYLSARAGQEEVPSVQPFGKERSNCEENSKRKKTSSFDLHKRYTVKELIEASLERGDFLLEAQERDGMLYLYRFENDEASLVKSGSEKAGAVYYARENDGFVYFEMWAGKGRSPLMGVKLDSEIGHLFKSIFSGPGHLAHASDVVRRYKFLKS
jgi:hypothetical protein